MYCSNCGSKNEGNKFCTNCGNRLDNDRDVTVNNKENNGLKTASIVLGILSLVGTFMIIFTPVSFILSLVGLILGIVANKKVRNVIGIVLNAIGLFLSSVIIFIIVLLIRFAINSYNGYNQNYYDSSLDQYFNDFDINSFGNLDEYFNDFFNNGDDTGEQYGNDYYENFKDIISIY